MNEKERLLSIGKVSKLTGVHIRCLRYYEELGILTPVFIDKDTKYRYYSYAQLRLVEAIQYCVELNIPLKHFTDFLDNDEHIDYANLIASGTEQINLKIQRLKNKLNFLESVQQEIVHGKMCESGRLLYQYLPKKMVWCNRYDGTQTDKEFFQAVYSLIDDVHKHGLKSGYDIGLDIGLLAIYRNGEPKKYIYINIIGSEEIKYQYPQITFLPAGNYYCTTMEESRIQDAPVIFPQPFEDSRDKIVVETELLNGRYRYKNPIYELRCHIVDNNSFCQNRNF